MLKVRTRLGPSPIHGIGLFAAEAIAAGTVLWEFEPPFDVAFAAEDLAKLAAPAREQTEKYAYFDAAVGALVLCGDDARFVNHSPTPNTREVGPRTIAARAIEPGEEITCDYAALGASI